jgi:hypothetical protein
MPHTAFHRGLVHQKLNDSGRAGVELEGAMSIDPKSPVEDKACEALSQITDK